MKIRGVTGALAAAWVEVLRARWHTSPAQARPVRVTTIRFADPSAWAAR
ncbi:MAG TPA: hypothetical protein VIS07_01185 [Candidatus Binatia bacterium]